MMMHEYASTLVVKYGGNAMADSGEADPLLAEIASLWKCAHALVLVHGGGPEIDRALARRGLTSSRIAGNRVTDGATLELTEAVLCGTLNKRLVRAALAFGLPAAGISGQDANLLTARRARGPGGEDLGFVGEIVAVQTGVIDALLGAGFLPVIAPLAIAPGAGHAFNVNADLAAAAIAGALRADAFVLVTNVTGVLRDPDDPASRIDRFTPAQASRFSESEACRSSMKPKLLAAAQAVLAGAAAAYICGACDDAIARALAGDATIVSSSSSSSSGGD
jgi:acetylglutamate kinase